MSALTDLFTAMANKIRSKTGTATTYTPSEMVSDGIDDVYDAGVASVPTPTSITPSNASPVSLTANTAVKPTANGYAISSYSNITPSDAYPLGLNSGDIYKMGGNGYAIESYYDVIPSSASPVTLADGSFYKVGSNGIAIDGFYTITPSNTYPANLTNGTFFKMAGNGKAIASYSSKTPSDSNPPSVAVGDIIKPTAAGYLSASASHIDVELIGSKTVASTSTVTFNLDKGLSGYKYIYVTGDNWDGDDDSGNTNEAKNLVRVAWFTAAANRTVTSYFTSGNTGSMYSRTQVMTYVNDTTVKIQNSSNVSRTIKIYGLK